MAAPKTTSLPRILTVFFAVCLLAVVAGVMLGSCTPKPALNPTPSCPSMLANECEVPTVRPPAPVDTTERPSR